MKLIPLIGLLFLFCLGISTAGPQTAVTLLPPDKSYNICILISITSHSHRAIFLPLIKELLNRGHKITILSGLEPVFDHPNVTELTQPIKSHIGNPDIDMFKKAEEEGGLTLNTFRESLVTVSKGLYKIPHVKDLYNRRKEFDLFLTDVTFNEPTYPFLHEVPFIMISTPGKFPTFFAVQGNVLNPSYVPTLTDYPRPWNFFNRIGSFVEGIFLAIAWRHYLISEVQAELTPQFPDLPHILDIERNVSLILLNSHFSLDAPVPLLPSQVEIGAIHCRPKQPLPSDIKSWIDGSKHGVVYFSLGSIAKGNTMPKKYQDMFLEAFSRLKQRVIWKFEAEIPHLPNNVMIAKWMPQQDILGDPNVKVFIGHGGLLGLQETIYHSTPAIVLPIFGDQPRNCRYVDQMKFGLCLSWKNLSTDIIYNSLQEIFTNKIYEENISKTSKLLKDTPMNPVDTAVFWTEYVARHKGAPHLRSIGADLSWVQYLLLDVIGFLLAVIVFTVFLIYKLVKCILCRRKPRKLKKN